MNCCTLMGTEEKSPFTTGTWTKPNSGSKMSSYSWTMSVTSVNELVLTRLERTPFVPFSIDVLMMNSGGRNKEKYITKVRKKTG